MLTHLLTSRYTSSSPPLIVLSDSLLQPGLSLLHQLLLSSPSSTQTIYLCIDQSPSLSIPPGFDQARLQSIDLTVDKDFPFASTSTCPHSQLDLSSQGAQEELEGMLQEAVGNAKLRGGAVQVVIDGVNSLGDQIGVNGVWRLIKKGLKAIEGLPIGSRFLLLHHDHFPLLPTSPPTSSSPLLSSLLSPLLSPSTIHLTLHPTSHLHTLALRYSLVLPTPTSFDDPDLRTTDFLSRLRERGLGDPLRRPERSDEDDERVLMDELGVGEGKAVLGWNCRGVNMGKVARSNGVGSGAGDKKVVNWGFEGVRRRGEEGTEVEEVELGRVLDPRKMGKVRDDALLSPPIQQTSNPVSTTSNPSSSSTSTTALPFSLSLTPSQLAARSLVQNPYEGSNQPIFGEAGYTGKMDDQNPVRGGGGLKVEYTADRGDDLDEEEPDEDLEI